MSFSRVATFFREFTPKSFICFREGYSRETFFADLCAGCSVGILALPLALAFAIASGVSPERGLFTAIVAGFLISLLGGSRVQIGGPTGAFVIIVYSVVQKQGYEGLAVATLLAAILMILMGVARLGVLLKFIPYTVTTGFTTGIALVIFSSQIKDFFGLSLGQLPPEFLAKWQLYAHTAHTWNGWAVTLALATLTLVVLLKRYRPRWPGALIALTLTTAVATLCELPVTTIASKFGTLPRVLPLPSLPFFSFELIQKVFPDALTIAFLGAIESLLSAVVADGMIGTKHRSNCELVAQGLANIGSILFGGIPATGAIARTSANIKLGAKTPVSGMIHALTLLFLMLCLAPLAGKIPLASLSALLVFVAWNMSELPHFIGILKGHKGDAAILLTTFLLTILIDLTVAVQIGILLSALLFLKRMTDHTEVEICQHLLAENHQERVDPEDDALLFKKDIPSSVAIFTLTGPFFYTISDLLDEALLRLEEKPHLFVLRIHRVPFIDATGLEAMKKFALKCKQKGILFVLSDVNEAYHDLFIRSGIAELIGSSHLFPTIDAALSTYRQCPNLRENAAPIS